MTDTTDRRGADDRTATKTPDGVVLPVFTGLDACGFSGRDIAGIASVSPATVSKWRHGRSRVPAVSLHFLTLILADHLENRRLAMAGAGDGRFRPRLRGEIEVPHRALRRQEALNAALPPTAIHEGARRFRHWWAARVVKGVE